MKKYILLALISIFIVSIFAQESQFSLRIWKGNVVTYQTQIDYIDSIIIVPKNVVDAQVTNGFYVVGPATGYNDLEHFGVSVCQMANGINEYTKAKREGMYEKYIVLEGGKEFKLIEKTGDVNIHYTASLEKKNLPTDGVDIENGYWGTINAGTTGMKVEETGLYHIILDLNKDNLLDAVGGAQVIVAPVEWGIRGYVNGWAYTKYHEETISNGVITWTWKNQQIGPIDTEFKFSHGNYWKIILNANKVHVETSLGHEMKAGGDNIAIAETGIYDITLTFNMADGDISNSYSYKIKKTSAMDPATFLVGISGTMNNWTNPSGATLGKLNESETNVVDDVTKAGTYVFDLTDITFATGAQFKFRINDDWIGLSDINEVIGVNLTEADGNITGVTGTYDIKITIVWDGVGMTSLEVAFTKTDCGWEEKFNKNGSSYVAKTEDGYWPYASGDPTTSYVFNNYSTDYIAIQSYGCTVRSKNMNGISGVPGFYFRKGVGASDCYLTLEYDFADGMAQKYLIFDIGADLSGADSNLSKLTMKINDHVIEVPTTQIPEKGTTATVKIALPTGKISKIHWEFDNLTRQLFMSHLRIECHN